MPNDPAIQRGSPVDPASSSWRFPVMILSRDLPHGGYSAVDLSHRVIYVRGEAKPLGIARPRLRDRDSVALPQQIIRGFRFHLRHLELDHAGRQLWRDAGL